MEKKDLIDLGCPIELINMAIVDKDASNQSIAELFVGLLLINNMQIDPRRVIMFPTEELRFELEGLTTNGDVQTFKIKDRNDKELCEIGINYSDILFEFKKDSLFFEDIKKLILDSVKEDCESLEFALNKNSIGECKTLSEILEDLRLKEDARENFLLDILSRISFRLVYNAFQLSRTIEEIMEALNFKIRSNETIFRQILAVIGENKVLNWDTFKEDLTEEGAIKYVNDLTDPQEIRNFLDRRGFISSSVNVWIAIAKNPNTSRDVLISLSKRVRATPELLKNILLHKNMDYEETIKKIFIKGNELLSDFDAEVKNELVERVKSGNTNISFVILYKFLSSITPEIFDKISENNELINKFAISNLLSETILSGTDKFIKSIINSDSLNIDSIGYLVSHPKISKELLSLYLDKVILNPQPKYFIERYKAKLVKYLYNILENPNCDQEIKEKINSSFSEEIVQTIEKLKKIIGKNPNNYSQHLFLIDSLRTSNPILKSDQLDRGLGR